VLSGDLKRIVTMRRSQYSRSKLLARDRTIIVVSGFALRCRDLVIDSRTQNDLPDSPAHVIACLLEVELDSGCTINLMCIACGTQPRFSYADSSSAVAVFGDMCPLNLLTALC
jgi:hypothetical protein